MITAAAVSGAIRTAGWRVRTTAPETVETIRVFEETPGRIKVKADFNKTIYAVWRAGKAAEALREAGYAIEIEDNKTFFYVTGLKKEG